MKIRITLVRHGETDSNVHRILQGSLNTPLNANGKEQARETGAALRETHFDRAFCSSLERCVQTAERIVSGRPLRTSYSREIWEKDLGILEGMQYNDAMEKMRNEGKVLDDYGEGQKAFASRLLAFWDSTILPFTKADTERPLEKAETQHILIVTHGGCIATLGRELVARGYKRPAEHVDDYVVPRSGLTEIEVDNNHGDYEGRIVRFGDHAHISTFKETLVGADAQIGKESSTSAA